MTEPTIREPEDIRRDCARKLRSVQVSDHFQAILGCLLGEDWTTPRLVEELHPEAEKVVLVMDNLNTHKLASLYEASPPEQARRIAGRLEIHHTPRHGSWLNVAEIELSVLARQCLDRRIETAEALRLEVAAWEEPRNDRAAEVRWRFTTADARIKLRHLYPSLQ
jgi:DDE superfamily endonuclease